MHEALLRARADSPRPTDEDVAAYLDGTIPDEGVRARVLGEIGVDPVLTEALLAEEGRGASLVESRPERLGGPRLAWRVAWGVAAVLVVATTASFLASDPDVERRRGSIELLEDGVVEGTDPMRIDGDRSAAQDAVWMVAAWFLLAVLTLPAWRSRSIRDSRDSGS